MKKRSTANLWGSIALVLVLAMMFAVLAGCSSSKPEAAATSKPVNTDPKFIRIGTASLGGNFFPMGTAIGIVIDKANLGVKGNAQATGGSSFNMTAIQKGEMELAIVQGTSVAAGMQGVGQFKSGKTDKVKTVANYNMTPQHIIVRSKLNASSVSNLKGLRLEMLAAGDGVEESTRKILDALGIDWKEIKPQYSGNRVQASSRLQTGEVDGIIDATGIGAAWLVDVIGEGDFKLISLSDAEITKIRAKYPEFTKVTIPAGTYKGQKEAVQTVGNWSIIVCADKLSTELVYGITKALYDNKAVLLEKHNYFKDLAPGNIKDAVIAPLHPGAEKYYKEKGILK